MIDACQNGLETFLRANLPKTRHAPLTTARSTSRDERVCSSGLATVHELDGRSLLLMPRAAHKVPRAPQLTARCKAINDEHPRVFRGLAVSLAVKQPEQPLLKGTVVVNLRLILG